MAMVKSVQALSSSVLAGQSWMQAEGIKSNEKKEGEGTEKVGDELSIRAVHAIGTDASDILKASLVLVGGVGMLYLGTILGGKSVQVSTLEVARKWMQKA